MSYDIAGNKYRFSSSAILGNRFHTFSGSTASCSRISKNKPSVLLVAVLTNILVCYRVSRTVAFGTYWW